MSQEKSASWFPLLWSPASLPVVFSQTQVYKTFSIFFQYTLNPLAFARTWHLSDEATFYTKLTKGFLSPWFSGIGGKVGFLIEPTAPERPLAHHLPLTLLFSIPCEQLLMNLQDTPSILNDFSSFPANFLTFSSTQQTAEHLLLGRCLQDTEDGHPWRTWCIGLWCSIVAKSTGSEFRLTRI